MSRATPVPFTPPPMTATSNSSAGSVPSATAIATSGGRMDGAGSSFTRTPLANYGASRLRAAPPGLARETLERVIDDVEELAVALLLVLAHARGVLGHLAEEEAEHVGVDAVGRQPPAELLEVASVED